MDTYSGPVRVLDSTGYLLTVGSADLDIIRANWGATAAAAVPEPSLLVLLLGGLLAIRRRN